MNFKYKRDIKPNMSLNWRASLLQEEIITLTCIGRLAQFKKCLIKEFRDYTLDREKSCTVVRRFAPRDFRAGGPTRQRPTPPSLGDPRPRKPGRDLQA